MIAASDIKDWDVLEEDEPYDGGSTRKTILIVHIRELEDRERGSTHEAWWLGLTGYTAERTMVIGPWQVMPKIEWHRKE